MQKYFKKKYGLKKLIVYLNNHIISRIIFSSVRNFWFKYFLRIELGAKSSILTDFKVSTVGNIKIGKNSVINNSCRFDNRFPIKIGNNVSISYGTHILTKGHLPDDPLFKTFGKAVVIEDYAWICTNSIILPGVNVGKGAVVLTGSVVTKNVEPYSIVGGNPAKIIKSRSKNLEYNLNYDAWVPFWG
jgi:acetyltransferase-like isoleucine patch superfamily enzyme